MILDDIVSAKRDRLEILKSQISYGELVTLSMKRRNKPLDLYKVLKAPGLSVIAEFKRASPSRGIISRETDPVKKAMEYVSNGASAISVLTEEDFFHGSFDDLKKIREAVPVPILCKDFILEEYQILYAYEKGADAILLIAALLDELALKRLYRYATSLGLSVLLEVHNEKELLSAARTGGRIIGVNNRDLYTFHVDLSTFGRLRSLIPEGYAVVCESGIKNLVDAEYAYRSGADALLVGESLMTDSDCGAMLRSMRAYG